MRHFGLSLKKVSIDITYGRTTVLNRIPENRLLYWREDVGINLLHWNWYVINPLDSSKFVSHYRRGEHFLFLHQQILARYNFERLCNGLSRVKEYLTQEPIIPENYCTNLDRLVTNHSWSCRHFYASTTDIDRPADYLTINMGTLDRWMERLREAITCKIVFPNGECGQPLAGTSDGINVLGNMMEYNESSINRRYYGPLHSMMLMMFGYINDPNGTRRKSHGDISNPATSLRDPLFYRWLATMMSIVQTYKSTLPNYTTTQKLDQTESSNLTIDFPDVNIMSVQVITNTLLYVNQFTTYWERSEIDLSKGLNFHPMGEFSALVTHLQHLPFSYLINVTNYGDLQTVIVRIFLAPKFDKNGRPFTFEQQRSLFVQMDIFNARLKSGFNFIVRSGNESKLTMRLKDVFPGTTGTTAEDKYRNCIEWPQHMLIPRGTQEGFACELFVMINKHISEISQYDTMLDGMKLLDERSLGFPFDRPVPGVNTLSEFLTPNMAVIDVSIKFIDDINSKTVTEVYTNPPHEHN